VQPDLLGLEISQGELRRLTGFDPDDVFRPSILQNSQKRRMFWLNESLIVIALTPLIAVGLHLFMIRPLIGASVITSIILIIIVALAVILGRWLWRNKTCPKTLTMLLDEVDKYHAVIKAIDINDQLETTGHPNISLTDREKVISALQLIREDLVRALRCERILRDNKELLANHQQLLVNNLASLQALEVNDSTTQYSQLLNQSLQIAIEVQAEMRKLQGLR
jgi:hypothetical protein